MHVSSVSSLRSRSSSLALGGAISSALLLSACGGSAGGSGQSGTPGEIVAHPSYLQEVGDPTKLPTSQFFIVDPNESGGASGLKIASLSWGRLVDVHEIDALGETVAEPVFRDMVIEPNILTDGTSYVLDRNPVTQRERLVIQARKTGTGVNGQAFDELLDAAIDALPPVSAKNDDGSSAPPFTTVPRNATVVVRFNDALDDGVSLSLSAPQNVKLVENVRVLTGYSPTTPYSARVIFDPNFGANVGGEFHSTRILVDMTTSQTEAASLPTVQDVNPIGLPASLTTSGEANVSIRIPSRIDIGSSQSTVLTNLSGSPLDANDNGPTDVFIPTRDVVRAFESGNSADASNGFLRDLVRPQALGVFQVDVTQAANDGSGQAGFDFLIDLTFPTTCLVTPSVGDVVRVGDEFLVVSSAGVLVGSDVDDLAVRSVSSISNALTLVTSGTFETPFRTALTLDEGCWVNFLPAPGIFPNRDVSTSAQILVRFDEPMDPASLSPFEGFLVVQGAAGVSSTVRASNLVVGDVLPNSDLTQFSFSSRLPFPHTGGQSTDLHLELAGAKDLAGNTLRFAFPFVDFELDPLESTQSNGALVLRFDSSVLDEYAPSGGAPDGLIDIRGQFFPDQSRGILLPRPVATTGWPIDRLNPVPQVMTAVPTGVFNPLNKLGTKIQTLWRYCDLGWSVFDETKYNLDVIGLNWSPIGGLVVRDFFDQFEIRLGHSRFLPDEVLDTALLPIRPNSGLPGAPGLFENNYLAGSNPLVVHNRALGYAVNPSDLFLATSNTPMMPYPLNRGLSPKLTYTWRDTAILTTGADGDPTQVGAPTEAEAQAGVVLPADLGDAGGPGLVPSFGLPLLVEIKCFPADLAVGLNSFDVSISTINAPTPNFRAYSAGGVNTVGGLEIVLPDSEDVPQGGFNANSTPPGRRTTTTADSVFYIGQLDTVVRVSRVHTVWLDSGNLVSPTWLTPILDPANTAQPSGTQVRLDFRGTSTFSTAGTAPFNAANLNAFGNPSPASLFSTSATDWSSDITVGNGKRYVQVRITFVNNIVTGTSPELNSLVLPFLK